MLAVSRWKTVSGSILGGAGLENCSVRFICAYTLSSICATESCIDLKLQRPLKWKLLFQRTLGTSIQ